LKARRAAYDGDGNALDGGCTSNEFRVLESLLYDQLEVFYIDICVEFLAAGEFICENH